MKTRYRAGAVGATAAVLILFIVVRDEMRSTDPIPSPEEISSVSLILYDDLGDQLVSQRIIEDKNTIRVIHDCLIPNERSQNAARLLSSGPVIGKLGFQSARETTWVEFVDAGKNPLCFRVGKDTYLRGGTNYREYVADHKRLYDVESENVDESKLFYQKLFEISEHNN